MQIVWETNIFQTLGPTREDNKSNDENAKVGVCRSGFNFTNPVP